MKLYVWKVTYNILDEPVSPLINDATRPSSWGITHTGFFVSGPYAEDAIATVKRVKGHNKHLEDEEDCWVKERTVRVESMIRKMAVENGADT